MMKLLRDLSGRVRGRLGYILKTSYDSVDDHIRAGLGLPLRSLEDLEDLEMPDWNTIYCCCQDESGMCNGHQADPLQHHTKLTLGDLSNDVHPVFAEANFRGMDYNMLLPVLRLATRLIDTDCLLPFWSTMLLGNERKIWHGPGRRDWHWAVFYTEKVRKLIV